MGTLPASDKFGAMTNIASGFAADLAAISPEGELIQAVVAGADAVAGAWSNVSAVFFQGRRRRRSIRNCNGKRSRNKQPQREPLLQQ